MINNTMYEVKKSKLPNLDSIIEKEREENLKWSQVLSVYQQLARSSINVEKKIGFTYLCNLINDGKVPCRYKLEGISILKNLDVNENQKYIVRKIILKELIDLIKKKKWIYKEYCFCDFLRETLNNILTKKQLTSLFDLFQKHLSILNKCSDRSNFEIDKLVEIWAVIIDKCGDYEDLQNIKVWALKCLLNFWNNEFENSRYLNANNFLTIFNKSRQSTLLTPTFVEKLSKNYIDKCDFYMPYGLKSIENRVKWHTTNIIGIIYFLPVNRMKEANINKLYLEYQNYLNSIITMVISDDFNTIRNKDATCYSSPEIITRLYLDDRLTVRNFGRCLASYHIFKMKESYIMQRSRKHKFLDQLECNSFTFYSYNLELAFLIFKESYYKNERKDAIKWIIDIASSKTLEDKIIGLAIDKLISTHQIKYQQIANEIINDLNVKSKKEAFNLKGVAYKLFDEIQNSHDEHITQATKESIYNLYKWYISLLENDSFSKQSYEFISEGITIKEFHEYYLLNGELMSTLSEKVRIWKTSNSLFSNIRTDMIEHTLRRCYISKIFISINNLQIKIRDVIGYIVAFIEYSLISFKKYDIYLRLFTALEDAYKICESGIPNRCITCLVGDTDMVKQKINYEDGIINSLKARFSKRIQDEKDEELKTKLMIEITFNDESLQLCYLPWRKKVIKEILNELKNEDPSNEYWNCNEWPKYKGISLLELDPFKIN